MYGQPLASPERTGIVEAQQQERRAGRQQRRRQQRRARLILWSTVILTIMLLGATGFSYMRIQQLLAVPTSPVANSNYPAVDGISCDASMQTAYHIHMHVSIYINGQPVVVPQGVGIAPDGSCFYWLHTHTSDGIIHVEAPSATDALSLNEFLTIWREKFSSFQYPAQLSLMTGWQVYINGHPFAGPVTSPLLTHIPALSHELVTLEYGIPAIPPDTVFQWPANVSQ